MTFTGDLVTFFDLFAFVVLVASSGEKRARLPVPAIVVVGDDVEDLVGGARPEVRVDVSPKHLSPAGRHVGHVIDRNVTVSRQAGEA